MNILTRLGQRWDSFRFRNSLRPEEIAEFRSYQQDLLSGKGIFGTYVNTSGENVSPESATRISTWFTCLQVRWDAVGMLPFNVFRRQGRNTQLATDHPAYILHTRPNPTMTPTQFWKVVQQKRDNYGNCYAPLIRDGMRQIKGANIIEDNNEVKVYCSAETGSMYYSYKGQIIQGADMLHFKGYTKDGKCGISLTEHHAETIGRLRSVHKYSNRSTSRNPGIYATSAQNLPMNDTQKKSFKDYYTKELNAFAQDGDIPVMYNGFELKVLGINPKDALYLEQIQATKEDIFGITKVPPKLAQNFVTGNTYNNSEQQGLDFLTWGLAINLKDIEEECNYKLFTPSEQAEYFCKFNEKALLRLDAKTQAELLAIGFKVGVYSINDMLEILDRNPIDGGDDHYVELNNLAPVRLQDEILAGRLIAPTAPTEEQKAMLGLLKRNLNGHTHTA